MSLILAVEPDRRQATRLAAVLRERPRTEVVIADSVAHALEALEARVPDVLLTSPLLSPRDEGALAGWLRDLGPAAAHVQALTIPIFTTAAPVEAPRGLLSKWRRRPPGATSPDGCEPGAFADHVAVYLARTEGDRPADVAPEPEPEAAVEPVPEPALAPVSEPPPALVVEPAPEPAFVLTPAPAFDMTPEPSIDPAPGREIDPEVEPMFDFDREAPPGLAPEPAVLLAPECLALDGRRPGLREMVARARPMAMPAVDTWRPEPRLRELLAMMARRRYRPVLALGPAEIAAATDEESMWTAVSIDDLAEPAPPAPIETPVREDVETPGAEDEVWVLEPIAEMEALIRAIQPARQAPPVQPAAAAPRTSSRPCAPEPRPKQAKKTRARAPRPLQDEWGFFDPEQCGFAALLAKLDEITEDDDAKDPGPETTVRLIAY